MRALKIVRRQIEKASYVQFEGGIDESSVLPAPEPSMQEMHVDFGNVSHVNSMGLRVLLRWVQALALAPRAAVTFTRVPRAVLRQLLVIRDLIPENVEVRSICAPFYCASCDLEFAHLFKANDWNGQEDVKSSCPGCGQSIPLDAVAKDYFSLFNQGASKRANKRD